MKKVKKGFTLIELLLSLTILSVVVTTANASFGSQTKIDKSISEVSDLRFIASSFQRTVSEDIRKSYGLVEAGVINSDAKYARIKQECTTLGLTPALFIKGIEDKDFCYALDNNKNLIRLAFSHVITDETTNSTVSTSSEYKVIPVNQKWLGKMGNNTYNFNNGRVYLRYHITGNKYGTITGKLIEELTTAGVSGLTVTAKGRDITGDFMLKFVYEDDTDHKKYVVVVAQPNLNREVVKLEVTNTGTTTVTGTSTTKTITETNQITTYTPTTKMIIASYVTEKSGVPGFTIKKTDTVYEVGLYLEKGSTSETKTFKVAPFDSGMRKE